ncbi:hypothetical protein, partial [Ruminobacter amylophilus]|uniref:hypothetical protein n=1 Tax=Ruminobacter amylophilus TaxID=867 RepID=UPI0038659173
HIKQRNTTEKWCFFEFFTLRTYLYPQNLGCFAVLKKRQNISRAPFYKTLTQSDIITAFEFVFFSFFNYPVLIYI